MNPIPFQGQNIVFAKDQPQYIPLPAYKGEDGEVVTCWSVSFREAIKMLFTGKIWLRQLTFNQPLQPIAVTADMDVLPTIKNSKANE